MSKTNTEPTVRWGWNAPGKSEEDCGISHTESEAHGDAKEWINEQEPGGQETGYEVFEMSGVDLTRYFKADFAERIKDDLEEWAYDDLRDDGMEDVFDFPQEKRDELNKLIGDFLRANATIIQGEWFTQKMGTEKTYGHVAGEDINSAPRAYVDPEAA